MPGNGGCTMKIEITMKQVKTRYGENLYQCGYCHLQNILYYEYPLFYNAGVCGWNCDVYVFDDIAISTGYRNMRGKLIPHAIIRKYDKIARNILKDIWTSDIKGLMQENVNNFLTDIKNL